jgi:hypothetical protein
VCLQRSVKNCRKVCAVIHKKLSCGGKPVARHAQGKFRLSVEENALRRKSFEGRTSSGGRAVRILQ